GAPRTTVGCRFGCSGSAQATRIGSVLPAAGTATRPTLARKRESRVRASCMRPQTSRSPSATITSPANTLNTLIACGVPDQPPGGASIRCSRRPARIDAEQARIGACSIAGVPASRKSAGAGACPAWATVATHTSSTPSARRQRNLPTGCNADILDSRLAGSVACLADGNPRGWKDRNRVRWLRVSAGPGIRPPGQFDRDAVAVAGAQRAQARTQGRRGLDDQVVDHVLLQGAAEGLAAGAAGPDADVVATMGLRG